MDQPLKTRFAMTTGQGAQTIHSDRELCHHAKAHRVAARHLSHSHVLDIAKLRLDGKVVAFESVELVGERPRGLNVGFPCLGGRHVPNHRAILRHSIGQGQEVV